MLLSLYYVISLNSCTNKYILQKIELIESGLMFVVVLVFKQSEFPLPQQFDERLKGKPIELKQGQATMEVRLTSV